MESLYRPSVYWARARPQRDAERMMGSSVCFAAARYCSMAESISPLNSDLSPALTRTMGTGVAVGGSGGITMGPPVPVAGAEDVVPGTVPGGRGTRLQAAIIRATKMAADMRPKRPERRDSLGLRGTIGQPRHLGCFCALKAERGLRLMGVFIPGKATACQAGAE